jgi:hypothetical protein
MMGGVLVVIVIFIVVWIIINVVRAQQDAAQASARRASTRPVGAANSLPQKTSSSDIDRFLQEIDRLRKKNQDQPVSESRPKPPPARPQRQPEPQRTREPAPRRLPAERKRPASERKPVRPPPPPPLPAQPTPIPVVTPATTPSLVSPIEQTHPEVQHVKPTGQSKRTIYAEPAKPLSGPLQILQGLFKSGEGVAAAIFLTEVLAQPKCRRRPGPV